MDARRSLAIAAIFVTSSTGVLSGCDDKPPTPSAPTTTSPPATTAAAAPTAAPTADAPPGIPSSAGASMVWDDPTEWEKVDHPSSMRKATYKIPKVEGDEEDGELSVTQVGGGVEANIERWEGQFSEKKGETKREEKTVGDYKVIITEMTGTFNGGGMPGMPSAGAKENWTMLAAIVMTEGNPHFFKLTGPAKTVAAARGPFDKMVDSFRNK